jgi:LysM domain
VEKSVRLAIKTGVLFICFFMLGAGIAQSYDQEYREHTVSKGETLWGISSTELVNPFLWPKVWEENPEIRNPDLIYPGQRIRIQLSLAQMEIAPKASEIKTPVPEISVEQRPEEPAVQTAVPEQKRLFGRKTILESGYILQEIERKGEIIGAASERTVFGIGDFVYIRTARQVNPGDRFYVLHLRGPVYHPVTGAYMGNIVTTIGVLEVVGSEGKYTKAEVLDMFGMKEIAIGDYLNDYFEIEPPLETGKPRIVPVSGYVVALRKGAYVAGEFQVVYVDRGKADGIEPGDLLPVISVGQYLTPNGVLQVINVREKTAAGILLDVKKEVYAGDRIGTL